jgi:uncharacterized 2Fe-2S/4Fe-4S cluster protein (DUF4445 family)
MKNKIKIDIEPIGKRIFLNESVNAFDAIREAGIGIKSVCAGMGTCGKCRIILLDKSRNAPTEREQKILTGDEIEHGVRLACQQTFDKNTTIYIPASSLTEEQKLQVTGVETELEPDPTCRKYYIELSRPTLSDMESDFSRIKKSLHDKYGLDITTIDFKVLHEMPAVLRENSWKATFSVRNGEIILIEGGDKADRNFGAAIDLGTTKIAVLLVDLLSGKTIDKKGVMNPQISFGEDVMSRINFAMQSAENLQKIRSVVIEQINKTVGELADNNNLSTSEILEIVLVGNTAMHHLFLGLPVKQLGLAPFVSLTDKPIDIKARDLDIGIAAGGYIYLPPPIAGFVGSDHLAMIAATNIAELKGNCLGIDIGTNTEIVLKSNKGLESVSTASGPAFEGAHIKYGMRAASGAIERVIINPKTCICEIQTINDKKPVGICGSGILDSVAELLKAEIINRRGKFNPESGCISRDSKGTAQYMLDPEAKISINQNDIVEIQLAKSAIRTGINILLENASLSFKDIDKIIIAGAFGSYIDPKNVVNIGMFPNVSLKKIIQVGNAAAVGAKMVLLSKKIRKGAEVIAEKAKYLELTVFPTFADHFAKSTLFPEIEEII